MGYDTWDPRGQLNQNVRMSGDWYRARRFFDGLGFKINKVTQRTMREEAEVIAARIRSNLKAQNYPHAPLAESTIEGKENPDNKDKILLDTEEFVNAIEVHQVGYRTWLVGVQGDEDLVKRTTANEFGAPAKNIPARPVFRPEIERVMASGRLRNLNRAFARLLGWSGTRNRIGGEADDFEGEE